MPDKMKEAIAELVAEWMRLAVLLNLCQIAGYKGVEALADAVTLTRYAVATRYPSEEGLVSRQATREAAKLASQVLAWVETQIEARP